MSSRVLRPGDSLEVAPIVWRQAGAPAPPIRPRPLAAGASAAGTSARDAGLGDLERQVEARSQAAYQKGLADGRTSAAQMAQQRVDPMIAALKAITQELAGERKRFRAEAERDTVDLAIMIARRVLHRELATDPEAILGLVMAVFQKLNARETFRLRVSSADAVTLEESRAKLDLPASVEIVRDGTLPAGSAVFETSRGELDASVDTQLAEIQRGFADLIRRRAK